MQRSVKTVAQVRQRLFPLRDWSLRLENPVAWKEMRSRMRENRTFTLLTAYTGLLSLALYLTVAATWSGDATQRGRLEDLAVIGRDTFTTICMLQLALVCVIAPALTAGSVTVEREQQTFDLLRLTRLDSRSILMGKLVSSLSFLLLLVLASVPLVGICFLFGGVSPLEVLLAFALIAAVGMLMGAVGLFWSVFCRKTVASTAAAYTTAVLLLLGLPAYAAFIEEFSRQTGDSSEGVWLFVFMTTLMASGLIPAVVAATLTMMVAKEMRPDWKPRLILLTAFGIWSAAFLLPLAPVFLSNFEAQSGGLLLPLLFHPFFVMFFLIRSEVTLTAHGGWLPPMLWAGVCLILYLALAGGILVLTTARFRSVRAG